VFFVVGHDFISLLVGTPKSWLFAVLTQSPAAKMKKKYYSKDQ
jgi:hypothetical protein